MEESSPDIKDHQRTLNINTSHSQKSTNSVPNLKIKSKISHFFGKLTGIINSQRATAHKINSIEYTSSIKNFRAFDTKCVEDVVIPRSDIIAIKDDACLDEINRIIIEFSHTRTLVYNDTLDNIIGFIHIKDLFKVIAEKKEFNLKKIIRKPIIAAPSMRIGDLLTEMQRKRTHIAVVIDEYGGTDGIVTIEDIIEEIFGRIDDEHNEKLESDNYKVLNETTLIASSRVRVEELEKIFGILLKEENDEFDTIGGLILDKAGNVPIIGTKFNIQDCLEIEIIDATPRTVKLIKLELKVGKLKLD
ncbi:MAG: HlyC/CorC family transporter [Rickettsiaceae bacterium]|nr:MAG: HlyC/CorC family transporter [Rickettsiaceae bacterium]